MSKLEMSADLLLPDDAVTQTFAILAKRGSGKTYTGAVMAEEMLAHNLQVIVIDPVGVWWGLRSSADGKGEGLPIVIAGGEHADIPITPKAGELLAESVVDGRLSIVVDLSLFRKGEQVQFMTDFAETLYRKNRQAVHLILDEADSFAPQRPFNNEARMLGAIEDIVRRGRARGIGVTMITQRPSVLNKNVLTQIEVLVALRLTAPLDQKAVDEWVKTHAEANQREQFMSSLPGLPVGTAWFWSPGWLGGLFQKVQVRKRHTLDSSSTPKAGEQAKVAKVMAQVDLDALKERLTATIQQAESDNPKVLIRQIADLKKQLADHKPQVEMHQVEVLPGEVMRRIDIAIDKAQQAVDELTALRDYCNQFSVATDTASQFNKPKSTLAELAKMTPREIKKITERQELARDIAPAVERLQEASLPKAERAILTVLRQFHPNTRKAKQLGLLAGYSPKSGGFNNALSGLRKKGLMEGYGDLAITQAGIELIGDDFTELPTGGDLLDYWVNQLGKCEGVILETLYTAYPATMNAATIADQTGYSRGSGGFNNALSRLRSLQLIGGYGDITIDNVFFEEG